MFSTKGHYGFCQSPEVEGLEVFFHAQDFHRTNPGEPLPIVGEEVQVGEITDGQGRRPRTNRVLRVHSPKLLEGTVVSFDSQKGWGFVDWEGGQAFFHMSDREIDWMPVIGSQVYFYLGYKGARERVCWARPVREQATQGLRESNA